MKDYGISGGKQSNSMAPTITDHYIPKVKKTSQHSGGVQRVYGGKSKQAPSARLQGYGKSNPGY